MDTSPNRLLYGDNLRIMEKMRVGSVDLIYLDPPFNSSQTYNLMYRTLTGRPVPEQAEAFFDTWQMTADRWAMLEEMPTLVSKYDVESAYGEMWRTWLYALKDTQPKLLSYLIYMLRRLLQMKTILKPTGSIYLHCDPTASHYLKILMDGIFEHQNFRNEIIWKRTTAHSASKRWNDVHDTILFYSKSPKYTWNKMLLAHSDEYEARFKRVDSAGKRWTDDNLTGPGVRHGESGTVWRGFNPTEKGAHWKVSNQAVDSILGAGQADDLGTLEKLDLLDKHGFIYWPTVKGAQSFPRFKRYLGAGAPIQDVVTDIAALNSQAKERLGYQTQKPIPLLRRIIEASTNPGEVVFDPFCGCGTTVYAAQESGRQWLGCDITVLAVDLVAQTLYKRYGLKNGEHFNVTGIPTSVRAAELLFKEDAQEFQAWAIQSVGGLPMKSRSNDRGIDGRLYYEAKPKMRSMVLQVKGGKNIAPTDIRDLRGVLERENDVDMAGFISLKEPSKEMVREAHEAGTFVHNDVKYPRIQMLTIRQILEEKREFKSPTKIGARVSTGQAALPL